MSVAALLGFVAVLLVVVITGGADAPDARLERLVLALRRPALDPLLTAVTDLGSFPIVVGLTVLAVALLGWRTRTAVQPFALAGGVAVTAATIYLVKLAVARSRPPLGALIGNPSADYAFPSGHTGDGSVVWVLSALLIGWTVARPAWRRGLLSLGVVVAAAIGCSRVYLGYHWGSDVFAGWLLALAVVTGIGYGLSWAGPASTGSESANRHQPSGASIATTSPP